MTVLFPAGYAGVPDGGSPPASLAGAADVGWVQRIARAVQGLLQGKINAVVQVTMAAGATSTTVTDARISATSGLYPQPLTTHAADLLYAAPYVLVQAGSQKAGEVVFDHDNTAETDQTFNLLIIG